MKTLKESILDQDFDVNVSTRASEELVKILDSHKWFTIGGDALTTKNSGVLLVKELTKFFENSSAKKGEPIVAYIYLDDHRDSMNLQIRGMVKNHPELISFQSFSSSPRCQVHVVEEPTHFLSPRYIKCMISDETILFWLKHFFEEKMKKAKRYEDS